MARRDRWQAAASRRLAGLSRRCHRRPKVAACNEPKGLCCCAGTHQTAGRCGPWLDEGEQVRGGLLSAGSSDSGGNHMTPAKQGTAAPDPSAAELLWAENCGGCLHAYLLLPGVQCSCCRGLLRVCSVCKHSHASHGWTWPGCTADLVAGALDKMGSPGEWLAASARRCGFLNSFLLPSTRR